MKYTKNIHNKLLLAGFKQVEEEEQQEPEYLSYTVYEKGSLQIVVCDSHKNVYACLSEHIDQINLKSYTDITTLDRLINS